MSNQEHITLQQNKLLSGIRDFISPDYPEYQVLLEELIELLRNNNEEHWANYFSKSLGLLYRDRPQKSIAHSLNAYGGMGSFNDSLCLKGASSKTKKRGFQLRHYLWSECRSKHNYFRYLFDTLRKNKP
ncbi:hypothetical protein CXF86_03360 [Shewanella sp. GutCb]|jgi:hypothetical protein|uniref:DUF6966 domain-containing protein n=1 Tax=Shewanella sp. GutCb TaxID=2058315 RepID=UPI000C7B6AAB|nr:hypothetical protein CXF86_03360 [Shewanella sp. GutCb]